MDLPFNFIRGVPEFFVRYMYVEELTFLKICINYFRNILVILQHISNIKNILQKERFRDF